MARVVANSTRGAGNPSANVGRSQLCGRAAVVMSKALPKGGSALCYVQGLPRPAFEPGTPPTNGGRAMTVGKIALGVLIGNLATAFLSWLVISLLMENQRADAVIDRVNANYNAMIEQQEAR